MARARQAIIREDSNSDIMESKITSFLGNMGDLNLGQIVMKKFQG